MKMNFVMIVGACLAAGAVQPAFAQGELQSAFYKSYAAEANKDFAGAIKALQAVEPTPSENYFYHLRLAWLSYLAGTWNESVDQYQLAAKAAPEAVEPLQGMLNPLAAAGKTAEIAKTHELILRVDPHNYKSLQQAAWLSYQAKNYKKAADYYWRALKLYPTDVEMMLGLAYSLKLGGDRERADNAFNQVLLLSPKNLRALQGLK